MNQRDHEILQLLIDREEEGIQLLLQQYGGLIKTIAFKYLQHRQNHVDECINDVLLAVWQNIEQYEPTKNTFKNWIGVISKYKAINIIRKYQKEYLNTSIDQIDEPMYTDNNETLHLQLWHDLIQDLSPDDQELMTLIYLKGYSPDEVATYKNMKTSNIYNRLSRAKKKLRALKGDL